MFEKLRRMLSGSGGSEEGPRPGEAHHHEGYLIEPAPVKEAGGWRVGATISRERDGVRETHVFIRADLLMSREDAVMVTVEKAVRFIDQVGERMFEDGGRP